MTNKIISFWFRIAFSFFITINYIYFIPYTWYPICLTNSYTLLLVFAYHFLILNLVWSLLVTAYTDPGNVPIYWGFYFGDADIKRRRYCLMCNVFKPERCQHCSVCNRCVLNMDHHCPWINNCVGYYNRKYFIQMLFYLVLVLLFSDIANAPFFYKNVMKIYNNKVNFNEEISNSLFFILIYTLDLGLTVIIGLFFKFHLKIILENKTTIETIDKKGTDFSSIFDLGTNKNWLQVMGNNKILWFFPIKLFIGQPIGNGIDWFESKEDEIKKLHNLSLATDHNVSLQTNNNNNNISNPNNNQNNSNNNNNVNIELNNLNKKNEEKTSKIQKIDSYNFPKQMKN